MIINNIINKGCRFATEEEIKAVKDAVYKYIVNGKSYDDYEVAPYYGVKIFQNNDKNEVCEIRFMAFDDCDNICQADISERFHCEAVSIQQCSS